MSPGGVEGLLCPLDAFVETDVNPKIDQVYWFASRLVVLLAQPNFD